MFSWKDKEWRRPRFAWKPEPHVLFLVTPPYSGSTAMAQLLNSGEHTMFFFGWNGEGQWLVPDLSGKDRWNKDLAVDYKSVRAAWMVEFRQVRKNHPRVTTVIEKSPPNMMRLSKLAESFKNHSFLANNRNPYAVCSSIYYRVHAEKMVGADEMSRSMLFRELAESWM